MATTRLKPIGHDDRLSIVEHLTELRTRIIICVVGFSLAFGICLWQEDRILDVVNQPLADVANAKPCDETRDPLEQADCWQQSQKKVNEQLAVTAAALADAAGEDPELQEQAGALAKAAEAAVASTPQGSKKLPVTLGVGEPLTATLVAAGYVALLLVLPLILWQAYAFILPAFSPTERQVAFPLMLMVPFLFYAGVVFAYFLVLPAAVDFLQNFNDDNYDVLLQARDYNKFSVMVMGVMGLLVPAARGDPGRHAHGDRDPAAAAQAAPDRDPGHRGRGRAAARRRPRDDAPDDAPDPRPLRRLYPSRGVARASPDARP